MKYIPEVFNICVTSKCNLNCWFCLKNKDYKKYFMTEKELSTISSKLYDYGIRTIELTPTVGDLLTIDEDVLKKYFEILNKFDNVFFYTSLASKEYSKDFFNFLYKKNIKMYISLYGSNRDDFNRLTNSNNYDILINNIKKLDKMFDNTILLLRNKTKDDLFFKIYKKKFFKTIDDYDVFSKKSNKENKGRCHFSFCDNGVYPNGKITLCSWIDEDQTMIIGDINNLNETYKDFENREFNFCKNCGFFKPKGFQREFFDDFQN